MEVKTLPTKRVLIVDDEPNVTMTLASMLEKLGDSLCHRHNQHQP